MYIDVMKLSENKNSLSPESSNSTLNYVILKLIAVNIRQLIMKKSNYEEECTYPKLTNAKADFSFCSFLFPVKVQVLYSEQCRL